MKTEAQCVVCEKPCKIYATDVHHGSPPCTDDSTLGNGLHEAGPCRKVLYVFLAMRRKLKEKNKFALRM